MQCINTNSMEFQTLLLKSGVPLDTLERYCYSFMNRLGRFPELDELPHSNSEPHLREKLLIRANNAANIQHILNSTNTTNVEEATQKLNDDYRDLDIEIIPIVDDAYVDILHKPSIYNLNESEDIEIDSNINNRFFFTQSLSKLASKHGINFILTNSSEVRQMGIMDESVKAFVYNNNIYINTDLATVDSPLHEMMHIIFGSLRYSNPELYFSLINTVENIPTYNELSKSFKNRTRLDVNEEIFVREISKQLTSGTSELSKLDSNIEYEITYGMTRMLDSLLLGKDSVREHGLDIYRMTFKELAKLVKSETLNSDFSGTIDLKNGQAHRILANVKEDLIKNKELKEYCI